MLAGISDALMDRLAEVNAIIEDAVEIVAPGGREAGVEVVRNLLGREHAHRMRAHVAVHGIAELERVP